MSYIGTTKIGKMFLGTTEIGKAYLGTDLVFHKGGSLLPAGYTELEYVENPLGNSAYINTGILTEDNTGFYIDAMSYDELDASSFGCLFGARYNSGSSDYQLSSYSGSVDSGSLRTGSGAGINAHLPAKNTRFTATLVGTTYTIGGSDYSVTFHIVSSRKRNIYLFALNNNNSVAQNGHLRIYAFSLTQEGGKVIDYIPCKDPNNVVGFYDLVSESFVPPTDGTLYGA